MVTEQKITDRALTSDEARVLHATIKKVSEDLEALSFNTAISAMMVFANAFAGDGKDLPREAAEKFVLLVAPFAPHLGEELWEFLGHDKTLAYEAWPTYDTVALVESEIEIPVQVLGKLRGRIRLSPDASQDEMRKAAEACEDVAKFLEGKTIVKVICVPKKMVNFVVR
jgi:leucyl-tRNA synthetase